LGKDGRDKEGLREAKKCYHRPGAFEKLAHRGEGPELTSLFEKVKEVEERFFEELSQDFNTPASLSHLFGLVSELNRIKKTAFERKSISSNELSAYEYAVKLPFEAHNWYLWHTGGAKAR
jgi:cysteinyl-tRNA synthetase